MLKRLFVIGAVLVMAGCTSPKFEGEAIAETNQTKSMTIIEDDATRDVFLASMLAWCNDNGYTCKVALDGSQPKQDELTLDYVSRWSWDFRTFIADAKISAYKDGARVDTVTFKAPNGLDTEKFGDDTKRIKAMMDILFDKTSPAQATLDAKNGVI